MAVKQTVTAAARAVPSVETFRIKIDGLRPVYNDGDGDTFEFDAPYRPVDLQPIFDHLREQGVEERLIDEVVDDMGQTLWVKTLSEILAKRIKRV